MSHPKKQVRPYNPVAKFLCLIFIVLAVVIVGLFFITKSIEDTPAPPPVTAPGDAISMEKPGAEPGPVASGSEHTKPKAVFAKLKGRWLREDGGYVIEISEVFPDGNLKAAYFNPNPIHVSQAAAVEEGGSVKVGIELNDVNYPGCLYTLVFNSELDQLQGTYFQAAQGQTYQIAFVRMPSE